MTETREFTVHAHYVVLSYAKKLPKQLYNYAHKFILSLQKVLIPSIKILLTVCYLVRIWLFLDAKKIFKFWWDEELDEMKNRSVASCRIWKAAGKPRSGPIFTRYRTDKAAYKHGIRSRRRDENIAYTNYLHESLF